MAAHKVFFFFFKKFQLQGGGLQITFLHIIVGACVVCSYFVLYMRDGT
jgi:hypothetical protein